MNQSGDFFDGFADQFDTLYDGKRNKIMRWIDCKFRSDIYNRFALSFELMGDLSDKTVVDIGCGSGPYIDEALRKGAQHVTGVDPAKGMLQLAQDRMNRLNLSDNTNFIEGYFPDVDLENKFDFAIVMGVMDYVLEPLPFIKMLENIVSDSAILSFPSRHWFRTPLRKIRYWVRGVPLVFYTEKKIASVCNEADLTNFEIIKLEGAGMDYVVTIRFDDE